jgi:hypothetical protein
LTFSELPSALLRHRVVFLRDQQSTDADQLACATLLTVEAYRRLHPALRALVATCARCTRTSSTLGEPDHHRWPGPGRHQRRHQRHA